MGKTIINSVLKPNIAEKTHSR